MAAMNHSPRQIHRIASESPLLGGSAIHSTGSLEFMDSEPYDIEALQSRIRAGWTPSFIFFWNHTSTVPATGSECLSQWYPAPFIIGGVAYRTAEHYMMAEKARLFGDQEAIS